jgi:hypothetical protein
VPDPGHGFQTKNIKDNTMADQVKNTSEDSIKSESNRPRRLTSTQREMIFDLKNYNQHLFATFKELMVDGKPNAPSKVKEIDRLISTIDSYTIFSIMRNDDKELLSFLYSCGLNLNKIYKDNVETKSHDQHNPSETKSNTALNFAFMCDAQRCAEMLICNYGLTYQQIQATEEKLLNEIHIHNICIKVIEFKKSKLKTELSKYR